MGKYLKKFETQAAYEAAQSGLILPNVSLITETNGVAYKPYTPPTPHDYVEIGGIKWATMNVGASRKFDTGLYFQWGDTQGYTADQVGTDKTFNWEDYKYWTADDGSGSSGITKYNSTYGKDIILEPTDDAVKAAWGGNWRMPRAEEFSMLEAATTLDWTPMGMELTDKTDSTKTLFFPAAGYCYNGNKSEVRNHGYYWSNFPNLSDVQGAWFLYFGYDAFLRNYGNRCMGFPVRGVLDE